MIVDPDFLDHWRTRMLVDALGGDELAPFYLIRLWGHCQQRKSDHFAGMPAGGLKALCRAKVDAAELERVMIEAGFLAREGEALRVLKWAEKNASLVSAWKMALAEAARGKPKRNPRETQAKPDRNRMLTHPYPIREEKRRVEKRRTRHPRRGVGRWRWL